MAVAALPGIKLRNGKDHTLVMLVKNDGKQQLITTIPRHFGRQLPIGTVRSIEGRLKEISLPS